MQHKGSLTLSLPYIGAANFQWLMTLSKTLFAARYYSAGQKFRTLYSWISCDPLDEGGPTLKVQNSDESFVSQ